MCICLMLQVASATGVAEPNSGPGRTHYKRRAPVLVCRLLLLKLLVRLVDRCQIVQGGKDGALRLVWVAKAGHCQHNAQQQQSVKRRI